MFQGSDVLAGAALGIFFAVLTSWITQLKDKKKHGHNLPITKYELSKSNDGNNS